MDHGSADPDIDSVVITGELDRRTSRAPDYGAENRALTALAEAMSTNPSAVLQRVAELTMDLTHSGSAGISLLEPGGENGTFRWVATTGAWSPYRDVTMPRDASPCGEVVARGAVLLVTNPERSFPALRQAEPVIAEGLLIPFYLGGVPVGTLWAIKHKPDDHFEAEDARLLKSLSHFASAAQQAIQALRKTALPQSEERQAFQLKLSDAIRVVGDPLEIQTTALRMLGEHLAVNRAFYNQIDEQRDSYVIHRTYANGVAPLIGQFRLSEIRWTAELAGSGQIVVFDDASTDPRMSAAERAAYAAMEIAAGVGIPLIKDGRWVAGLGVHHSTPRQWTTADIELIRETAERTWAAVEQAHAETALLVSEARFRALATVGSSSIYRMSPNWHEMRQLDEAAFLADTDEATADWVDTYIPFDERRRIREAIEQAITTKGVFELEHRVLRADGTVGWTFSRAIPLLDDAGEILEWLGAATDVTARVKKDQSFTRLFRASPAPFLILKPDAPQFTIAEVNDAYLSATMRTRDEVVGRGIFEAYPDNPSGKTADGVSILRASLEYVLASLQPDRLPDLKYDIAQPDGTFEERWWSPINSAILDDDGEVEALIHNANDTTEERKAEIALRASEAGLRELNATLEERIAERTADRDRLWQTSQDLLMSARFDGTFVAVNPAWLATLGWSEAELVGTQFWTLIHPDDLAACQAEALPLTTGEQNFARADCRYRAKSGDWRWLAWATSSDAGLFHGVARDITDEKARQAELEATQDQLRQSQKVEAMGQLTGGVAHDFNNLLTPIVYGLELAKRAGFGTEREQYIIAGAIQSADRATTLVQRLLSFARRQPLQSTSVDLAQLVCGLANLLSSTVGPQITVTVDAPAGLPPAKVDANQLEMAILNLTINARDAMPKGGTLRMTLSSEDVAERRQPHDLPPGPYLRLSVADTGEGMDEATIKRAVEPFFSTKGVGKGTGLGLSMAHGLAAQLGGALVISSTRGAGTTIEFWLPQSTEPVNGTRLIVDAAKTETGGGVVLLVDDEELVRLSTAGMLTELGYDVVEAKSAEDALKLIEHGFQPDFLVTDHLMPGMSGTELAKIFKSLRPATKLLIVSGYAEAEGIVPDLPRLAKPFRNAELAASLAALT